jgi:hypothetical protein
MIPHVEARQSTIAHIRDKFNNPNKVKIVMDFFDIFFLVLGEIHDHFDAQENFI